MMETLCWRRFDDHGYIAGFSCDLLQDVDGQDLRMACLVLQDLDKLMLDHFVEKYDGTVHWQHKVVSIEQDDGKAWAEVETPEGPKRIEADYIVGCDGANSTVRKSLFGDEFPGFTWDAQIVATNVGVPLAGSRRFRTELASDGRGLMTDVLRL
jgi:2-polyprenyl-6-methoxyphenol hydroxylase-like FAD-dependent oxidoreductase